jgi:hypothetical protein
MISVNNITFIINKILFFYSKNILSQTLHVKKIKMKHSFAYNDETIDLVLLQLFLGCLMRKLNYSRFPSFSI